VRALKVLKPLPAALQSSIIFGTLALALVLTVGALIVYSANSIVQLLSVETTPRRPRRKAPVEGQDLTPAEAPNPLSKAQWRPI